MARQTHHFMDFTGGYVSKGVNPFAYPPNVVTGSSKNIEFSDQGIKTRKGTDLQIVLPYYGEVGMPVIIRRLKQVRFQRINKRYTFIQGTTADNPQGFIGYEMLFLDTSLLPSGAISWADPLLELITGDATTAGDITLACLGDRAIFTEGEGSYPWVFSGGQETDGSDWAFPKAVLVNQSGDRVYDVSSQVCDDDVDSVAMVAGITSDGWIDIVLDVPNVAAFLIQMGTANSLDVSAIPAISVTQTYDAVAKWTTRNLQGTAVNWVQDSGTGGHFENSSNVAVTLGVGKTCPLVEKGLTVVFADETEVAINDITGDGDGSGNVVLDTATASQAVTGIYGLVQDIGGVRGSWGNNVWSTVATATGNQGIWTVTDATNYMNFRTVIPGSVVGNRTHLRFVISNSFAYSTLALQPNAYFGTRSGSTDDFGSTPTLVTFSNLPIPISGSATSDAIAYTTNTGGTYLFAMSFAPTTFEYGSSSYTQIRASYRLSSSFTPNYYKYAQDPEDGTLAVTYTSTNITLLTRIEALATSPVVPTQRMIMVSTADGDIDVAGAEDFYGITVSGSTPGSSTIYYAFSFDNKTSFSMYTGSAWQQIVRDNSGTWQYWNGSAFASASANDMYTALDDAWGVSANRATESTVNAWTQANWKASGGWIKYQVSSIPVAAGATAVGTDVPIVKTLVARIGDFGVLKVEPYRNGIWVQNEAWTDGTEDNSVPLAQDGIIEYAGTGEYSTATYATLNSVPGFHYRLRVPGTASDCSIAQIRYKAHPQRLQNIGTTGPDQCSAVLWEDISEGTIIDISTEMADATYSAVASADIPLETGDRLYFCSPYRYNEIEITPFSANALTASFTGEYYDGGAWRAITFADGTKKISGKTLSGPGKWSFQLPDIWELTMPFDTHQTLGRWTRFTVSTTLTSTTALAEARVYVVPDPLAKYKFAALVDNRLALCSRPQARDQVDLSRPYEEYGFCSTNSGSYRLGGADGIKSVTSAYNGLLFSSREMWSQIRGDGQGGFQVENVEAARYVPCNQEVIVKAPYEGSDGSQHGLFFLNAYGAWVSTGLQVDTLWNTARGVNIGQPVSWWDEDLYPHIDLQYISSLACGQFYPPKNWLVWAVPMLDAAGSQGSNNRLIIYDLTLKKWLPPVHLSFSCLELCYEENGTVGLYGGAYDGNVYRIFSGAADVVVTRENNGETVSSEDADIPWIAETGWLSFDTPQVRKSLEGLQIYARGTPTDYSGSITEWINDSENADTGMVGHFNAAESLAVGMIVVLADGTRAFIKAFTTDGTGDGDVELSSGILSNLPSASVTAIYKPIEVNFRRDGETSNFLTTPIRIDAVSGKTDRPFHDDPRAVDLPFNFLKVIFTGQGPVEFGYSLTVDYDEDETE